MPARHAIYLDANAASPLRPEVIEALRSLLSHEPVLANPSSIHAQGRRAKRWISDARDWVAGSLGVPRDRSHHIVFTSSGTEANQLAIRGTLERAFSQGKRPHWILTPVEHDSTLRMAHWLESRGGSVSFLPVDRQGGVVKGALEELIRAETALVSVLWVNNETGVVNDIPTIAKAVGSYGVRFHVDAAQAWGKLPLNLESCGADWVTLSGHKIGALAGVGALWMRDPSGVEPLLLGSQERSRRGGSENLLGIVSLGTASRTLDPVLWQSEMTPLREKMEREILRRIPSVILNGAGTERVANTSNFTFPGIDGEGLIMALDLAGYSLSAGSACGSGTLRPSHVLLALGRSPEEARASLRVSLWDGLTWEQLEGFVSELERVVTQLSKPSREVSA